MRFMRALCAPGVFPERRQFYRDFADFANEDAAVAARSTDLLGRGFYWRGAPKGGL
jgi:hypothetical protein